ncbi:putative Acid phosphatase [Lupinus albus]|uniref:Purple acid phosphatase n=1 Tax=Lupinus albus TaxID=3870 RepID=A0A6A4PHW4_LUPAL|nr:putative Acid phosphatase [Lupinus albus]
MGLLVLISTITLCFVASSATLQRFTASPKKDESLSFLVVGDWGRKGAHNQTKVAAQMAIHGKKLNIDFVISTGDNFYNDGLTSTNDPAFAESFTKIYTAPSLQKKWYNVLGNHDYKGNVSAQLSPLLQQCDKRWICLRSFIVNAEAVDFFFIDTNPFLDDYFKLGAKKYDWSGVLPRPQYISNLLKDVDLALKQSRAKWKFVVGHHPIKSAGENGSTKELEKQLQPILEFITSGGGSKAWKGVVRKWDPKELKLYYDGQGFISVQITNVKNCVMSYIGRSKSKLDIVFYDVDGKVLHKWNKSK